MKPWRKRFAKTIVRAVAIYDERFCRIWKFYLIAVELDFLHDPCGVTSAGDIRLKLKTTNTI